MGWLWGPWPPRVTKRVLKKGKGKKEKKEGKKGKKREKQGLTRKRKDRKINQHDKRGAFQTQARTPVLGFKRAALIRPL